MHQIVELNDEGGLYLPSELLARLLAGAKPHTRYALEAQGESLILTRLTQKQPFWATATPLERSKAFHDWATSHMESSGAYFARTGGLPDEALRRETIYE